MTQNNQYQFDLTLFIGSIITFLYVLFMMAAYKYHWDLQTVLRAVMELITIPILLTGISIPIVVVFRFILKKTNSKALAMFTLFFSLLTAILIGYAESSHL